MLAPQAVGTMIGKSGADYLKTASFACKIFYIFFKFLTHWFKAIFEFGGFVLGF